MPEKSLYQQISNPIETYTDGYGHTREVYEPKYVGVLRKAYNLANRFLNGPSEEDYQAIGIKKPQEGLGILEFLTLPEASVLKSIRVTSTKNLPKTYAEAVSEYDKLGSIVRKRGKLSKQEESRFNFLNGALADVEYAAQDVATERTKRAWKAFDEKLEAAEKSPKPEMIRSDFEQANIPSYYLWEKPMRVQEDPKEMWELMYKNIEMKEKAAAAKKAKDVNNYSAGSFKDNFQHKQGGILKRK